ncbi:MAG: TolC family protein, partial [Rectinemataceae bacterium]|nr:TolC family protein [Rectinemataceae bacterium]
MKKLFAIILIACVFTDAHAGENVARLTLSDAIKTAVEKNLDLRAEIYNVAQFEADVQRSRAIYDPSLTLQTAYNFSPIAVATTSILPASAPGSSNPSSGDGNVQTDIQTVGLNSSLSQLLWTGGTIAAVFNNTYTNTTFANAPMPGSFLGSYWQTNAGFTCTQPLLKNFGRENTELNITVSRLSKYASMEHFNNRLTAIVSQVRTEYFKLYSLREALQVRKVSLDLARKILNDTRAR